MSGKGLDKEYIPYSPNADSDFLSRQQPIEIGDKASTCLTLACTCLYIVANKWIHERGQEFMRPCGLSPN